MPKRKCGPKIRARGASRNARWSPIRVIGGEARQVHIESGPDGAVSREQGAAVRVAVSSNLVSWGAMTTVDCGYT
jgi:hypothetical protein